MTTTRELITGALRLIGVVQVNETPTAADMQISLDALQGLVDSWATERLYVYNLNPSYFPFVPGQKSYTIGPEFDSAGEPTGADWVIQRPMDILKISVRYLPEGSEPAPAPGPDLNQQGAIDIPMEQLTFEQYGAITIKNTTSQFPLKFYDDAGSPTRTLTFWPVPQVNHWAVCWLWEPIINFEDLDQVIDLPPGYFRALRASLARELADEFGRAVTPDIERIAVQAKATIKRLNSTPPILRGSAAIASNRASLFNYITGDTIGGTGLL